jgi:hypothetical protein
MMLNMQASPLINLKNTRVVDLNKLVNLYNKKVGPIEDNNNDGITIHLTGAACGTTTVTGTNGITTKPSAGCKNADSEASYVAIAASTMALAVSATLM